MPDCLALPPRAPCSLAWLQILAQPRQGLGRKLLSCGFMVNVVGGIDLTEPAAELGVRWPRAYPCACACFPCFSFQCDSRTLLRRQRMLALRLPRQVAVALASAYADEPVPIDMVFLGEVWCPRMACARSWMRLAR